MFNYIRTIIFACVTFFAAIILFFNTNDNKIKEPKIDIYMLKSYKNTVALYKNGEIEEIYNSIVLNTLPLKDIQSFEKGIVVASEAEAELLLEDYDG